MSKVTLSTMKLAIFTYACLAGLSSCATSNAPQKTTPPPTTEIEETATAPTLEEAHAFSTKLVETMTNQDPTLFIESFNDEALIDRTLVGVEPKSENAIRFLKGFVKGTTQGPGFATKLWARFQRDGSTYEFLRVHKQDGETRALLRLAVSQAGLNYHDLVLQKNSIGNIEIIDIYTLNLGELLSDTLRYNCLAGMAASEDPEAQTEYSNDIKTLLKLTAAIRSGDYDTVVSLAELTPPNSGIEKHLLVASMSFACSFEEHEAFCMQTIEKFTQRYPDNPAVALYSSDYYLIKGQYTKALKALDLLDAVVQDPYVDTLRAAVYYSKGDYNNTIEFAHRSVTKDPTMFRAWDSLLGFIFEQKDWEKYVSMLIEMEQYYEVSPQVFDEDPDYDDLVSSPAYKQWKSTRQTPNSAAQIESSNN